MTRLAHETSAVHARWRDPAVLAVAALTVVAFALRVGHLNDGLWHDEVVTIGELRGKSLGQMLDAVVKENTPPLYF